MTTIGSSRFAFLARWSQVPGTRTPEENAVLDDRDRQLEKYLFELDRRITALEA